MPNTPILSSSDHLVIPELCGAVREIDCPSMDAVSLREPPPEVTVSVSSLHPEKRSVPMMTEYKKTRCLKNEPDLINVLCLIDK